jgi:hypothetical protein
MTDIAVDLKPSEVAAVLRVSEQTLANWRSAGTGPPYRKLSAGRSGLVRYPSDRFESWRVAQIQPSGEAA